MFDFEKYLVCVPCLTHQHTACINGFSLSRRCWCDTCAQIRKDAEDDKERSPIEDEEEEDVP